MSVEQLGVLALVGLLLLLEGMTRLRRAHARTGETGRLGEKRWSRRGTTLPNADSDGARSATKREASLPPPLASPPTISLPRLSARGRLQDSAFVEARAMKGHSAAGAPVVQWLRSVRNLRRAIVVAAILSPRHR